MFAAVCAAVPVGTALVTACDTDRLIPPQLALGHRVLGDNRSPAMLEHAQRRAVPVPTRLTPQQEATDSP